MINLIMIITSIYACKYACCSSYYYWCCCQCWRCPRPHPLRLKDANHHHHDVVNSNDGCLVCCILRLFQNLCLQACMYILYTHIILIFWMVILVSLRLHVVVSCKNTSNWSFLCKANKKYINMHHFLKKNKYAKCTCPSYQFFFFLV